LFPLWEEQYGLYKLIASVHHQYGNTVIGIG